MTTADNETLLARRRREGEAEDEGFGSKDEAKVRTINIFTTFASNPITVKEIQDAAWYLQEACTEPEERLDVARRAMAGLARLTGATTLPAVLELIERAAEVHWRLVAVMTDPEKCKALTNLMRALAAIHE